ncbi:hypothetical protein AB8B12_33730, partial [Streptomyces sp. PGLac3x]
ARPAGPPGPYRPRPLRRAGARGRGRAPTASGPHPQAPDPAHTGRCPHCRTARAHRPELPRPAEKV